MVNSIKDKSAGKSADAQANSWKSLNLAAIAIIFINSTLYFLITKGLTRTLVINFFFLTIATYCHNYYLNISTYRYESSKLKLATQRRKAILLGISFRENFSFPHVGALLGGTKAIFRLTLVASLFGAAFYFRDYIGLSLLSWVMGLLILFALSPTWLWIPVLFSMFFLGAGSHQNYGARHIVSFLTLTLIGIQCLLFAWHVGNRLESIKLQINRTASKQNRSQVALLSLAFVGIATIIFIFLPKQLDVGKFQFSKSPNQRKAEGTQNNKIDQSDWSPKNWGSQSGSKATSNTDQKTNKPGMKTKTDSNSQPTSGTGTEFSESYSSGVGSTSNDGNNSIPSSNGSGNPQKSSSGTQGSAQSGNASGPTQEASTVSEASGNEIEVNSGEEPNEENGASTQLTSKELAKNAPNKETKKERETNKANTVNSIGSTSQKSNENLAKSGQSSEKQGTATDMSSAGKKTNEKTPPGISKSKSGKESIPEKKSPEKIQNKRLIRSIIIVATVLLIGFILLMLSRRKKPEKKSDSASEKDLPTKSEIAQAMQKFKADYKAIIAAAKSQEDLRVLVISLYNLLLTHYEGCGLGKPNYVTPDEFHRNEYIYRTWSKNALAHVTETFNKVFYGNKIPAPKDFATYCDNVAQLGQMLAKIAPSKAN